MSCRKCRMQDSVCYSQPSSIIQTAGGARHRISAACESKTAAVDNPTYTAQGHRSPVASEMTAMILMYLCLPMRTIIRTPLPDGWRLSCRPPQASHQPDGANQALKSGGGNSQA